MACRAAGHSAARDLRAAFEAAHRRSASASSTPARRLSSRPSPSEAVGGGAAAETDGRRGEPPPDAPRVARQHRRFFSAGRWHDAARASCATVSRAGHRRDGPALDRRAAPDGGGGGRVARRRLTPQGSSRPRARHGRAAARAPSAPMPIRSCWRSSTTCFMSIAEQMGVTLQNTAYSVNIKERLDFSCAVFDARGLARRQRAAHASASRLDGPIGRDRHPATISAHAGRATSTGSTRHTMAARICPTSPSARRSSTRPGEKSSSRRLAAGTTPISAASRQVRCRRRRRHRGGGRLYRQFQARRWGPLPRGGARDLLTGARYPARNATQNVNDLKAQIAANEKGVEELRKHGRRFRARRRPRLYGPRAGQCRRERAPRHRAPLAIAAFDLRDGPRLPHPGPHHGRQGRRDATGRFHRHLASSAPTISMRRSR